MKTIRVLTAEPYEITVGSGCLNALTERIGKLFPTAEKICLVTDAAVEPLYGQAMAQCLQEAGYAPSVFVLPQGEQGKTPAQYFALLEHLTAHDFTRTDAVAALGGGSVSDLAGFAAATYLRGIGLLLCPTTLLGMVDAAIGGKNGVNLSAGKNQVGSFYQPAAVLCDTDVLAGLPESEWRSGCGEVLKYAVLGDRELLNLLRERGMDFDREAVVAACAEMKSACVSADERDHGDRKLLNLGHTVGHAIEARSNFAIPHGVSVGIGIAVAARAACAAGICCAESVTEIETALQALRIPTHFSDAPDALVPFLLRDKKRRGGKIDLIVPERVGCCRVETIETERLWAFLKAGF